MGGAVSEPGNITPVAEFNVYADAVAAARLFALTSPRPASTLPPLPPSSGPNDQPPTYPKNLSRRLRLSLFPLDITSPHLLHRSTFESKVRPLVEAGSPLAEWVSAFVSSTFHKISTLLHPAKLPSEPAGSASTDTEVAISLHDPLCIWYILTRDQRWEFSPGSPEDIRIETGGQWTRGMCVVDRRQRLKMVGDPDEGVEGPAGDGAEEADVVGDAGRWLDPQRGNRVYRAVESPCPPGPDGFGRVLLERVFG